MKERFVAQAPAQAIENAPKGARLYLARPKDARNGRAIGNEDDVIATLEEYGFTAVYPEKYTIFEQAALFAQADVIVAPHGAAMTSIVKSTKPSLFALSTEL